MSFLRAARRAAILGIIVGLFSIVSVSAYQWQVEDYLQSIRVPRASKVNSPFMFLGLRAAKGIEFSDSGTNQYQSFMGRLVLSDSLQDGGNRLRPYEAISSIDLGILAHESWHSYLDNYIMRKSSYARFKKWITSRARNLFWDLPESKQLAALDEAYAIYIGSMVTAYRGIQRDMDRQLKQDSWDCGKIESLADRFWSLAWNEPVYGYYYRDTISEYWEDKFTAVINWISGEKSDQNSEGIYYVKQSITDIDRDWIAENVLKTKFSRDYLETFGSELRQLSCRD
ncbi:MAG: hypothetical protein COV44_00690 [Deltaproteobacteria bacterium CG11_big_fil_rev_8_21_14_0_20_45_16]|nr:MAG: hypothetical protein COV44_00690 [Deltaproteobacteria bacterium CG11_big_fil_rev_8_21_14_0_20_45_16]